MTNLPSTKTNKLTLMEMINARKEELQKLMPKGVTVDHFTRILANAVLKDKNLNSADLTNVFLEVSKAAQDGLMLDGREAALVAYGNGAYVRFFDENEYRVKPKTILIGDIEVDHPETMLPEKGEAFYFPDITSEHSEYYDSFSFDGGKHHRRLFKHGMAYLTKEEAIQHAKAIIKASGGKI